MRLRSLSYGIIILSSLLFVLFIVFYQHYAVSAIRQKISEHAEVVEQALWNYEEMNNAYFILAAQANNYASIIIHDRLGVEHSEIAGPAPTILERWLMALKLVPLYRFQTEIEHADEKIGLLIVTWRCTTIYVYIYVGLCLTLAAFGIRLSLILKFAKTQLETQNTNLHQEIVERRRAETALQQVRDHLEQRVKERTTELADANAALQKSEQQFRDIAKNIPGMVYQFRLRSDGSTYFSYASPKGLALFGLSDLLIRKDWTLGKHAHPDDRDLFLSSLRQSMTEFIDWDYEGRLLLPSGEMKWLKGIASPIRDGDELVLNGILLDISARKQAEEELRKHQEQLEELVTERTEELALAKDKAEAARRVSESANRAKSTFLANMSHELRTPLNAILGFSQLMARDPDITEIQRGNLSVINRSGEHLLTLINDILDMSKIGAGQSNLEISACNLDLTLTSIEEMLRLRAEEKGLKLVVERASDLPCYIRTDERKLRQILINLLSNAVKFTQQGSIQLSVTSKQLSPESGQLITDKHSPKTEYCLLFTVKDTGIGIPSEELERIFDPFVQAADSWKASEGTGLGLAISRQFVHLMGGELTVTSQVGEGSVFTFTILAEITETTQIEQQQTSHRVVGLAPDQHAPDGGRYRILIAEDKEFNRILLYKLLKTCKSPEKEQRSPRSCFENRTAVNGREAFEIAKQWQPHLIFMDIRMPVMDGYEATREIRKFEANPKSQVSSLKSQIIIIALTASVFEEDRQKVLDVGCDDFIRKPFKEEDIFEKMTKYLGIQFVYEEEEPKRETQNVKHEAVVTPEALATLSPDILNTLEQSAAQLNVKHVDTAIASVRQYNAPLADALRLLAKDFKYQDMWNAIQRAKSL